MNSILINAKISFNASSKKWIASWPLIKNFRTSFWLKGQSKTCPCEIQSSGEISQLDTSYEVTIMLPQVDFLKDNLLSGTGFYFGLHSEPIGEGTVR